MHAVIDSRNAIKFTGTEQACRLWIRKYRSEFFCRVETIPCANHPPVTSPAQQQLKKLAVLELVTS